MSTTPVSTPSQPRTASGRPAVVSGLAVLLSVLPLMSITNTDDWLLSAAVAIALVVGCGHLLRRLAVPALVVPLAQLALLVLWVGVLVARDAALLGFIPTTDWATRLVDVFGAGTDVINSYVAPVPVPPGILLMLVGGAGLAALLVDGIALGLRKTALAGVPLAACYTVTTAVTPGSLDWWWFIPPAAGYLALLISEARTKVAAWGRAASPSSAHSGVPETDSLARNGRRVSMVALAAAVAVPGTVPVLTEGLLGAGRGGGGGGGQTIRTDNPIVDLQQNLQRPENVDVLTYRSSADEPQYIRTVALDVFDGQEWKTSKRPVPDSVDGGLPLPQGLENAEVEAVSYAIDVTSNYSSRWLPLPYPPRAIDIEGDWRYHAETLDVVSPDDDVQGMTYSVEGLTVEPDVDTLRSAGDPGDELDPLLRLPDDLPDVVTEYARSVTRDADTDFGRAAALQDWFRADGGFVYSIESQPGHSATALEDFLNERTGYCEQFAASMAIMARALGIPARVAVGFTPGDYQGDATWLVRAHDSHAWPELYFEGVGWVRFEPTPASRTGMPPDWTFVPSQINTESPSTSAPRPSSSPTASQPGLSPDDDTGLGAASSGGTPPSQWPLVALGVLLMVAFLATPWLHARAGRAWRWRQVAHGTPAAAAEAAWADLRDAARDAGVSWDPAQTPRAIGRHLTAAVGPADDSRQSLERVVAAVERARFAPHTEPEHTLRSDAAHVRAAIMHSVPFATRVGAFLLPARLRDAAEAANQTFIDGFDRLDAAGERGRAGLTRLTVRTARLRR